MRRDLVIFILVTTSCLGQPAVSPAAAPPAEPLRQDYSSFRIIADRNIFNQRRYARATPQTERRENRRSTRVEYVTLVGTMSYDRGVFAFFDGSRSEYQKALRQGETIASNLVAVVAPGHARLTSGTNEFELSVGKQLRCEENGPWEVRDAPESRIASYSPPSSSRASAPTPAADPAPSPSEPPPPPGPNGDNGDDGPPVIVVDPGTGAALVAPAPDTMATNTLAEPPPPGGDGDVLRRLMQRREEELNR